MIRDIVLYNTKGKPIAFLQIGIESVIYLIDGQAVAYLEYIGNGRSRIWGLNGKHLGWYDDIGIVYNADALRIGFNREKYSRDFGKQGVVKKGRRRKPILLPDFSLENTEEGFDEFLKNGI